MQLPLRILTRSGGLGAIFHTCRLTLIGKRKEAELNCVFQHFLYKCDQHASLNISCILSCFSVIQSSEWKRIPPILSRNELQFGNRVGVKDAWVNCTHGGSPAHRSCPHMLSSRHTARTLGYTASSHCGRRTAPSCSAALKHNKNTSAWNKQSTVKGHVTLFKRWSNTRSYFCRWFRQKFKFHHDLFTTKPLDAKTAKLFTPLTPKETSATSPLT